jgi:methionine aminopeptidase
MVFTIEPILVEGDNKIAVWEDSWTAVTVDGSRYVIDPSNMHLRCNSHLTSLDVDVRAAQFEHEVLITSSGVEILTMPEH